MLNKNARPKLTIRKYAKQRSMSIFNKSIVQILLWQMLTIAIYYLGVEELPAVIQISNIRDWSQILRELVIKILLLLYPLGTIVGDVWLGRYKTIIISLLIMTASLISSSIGGIILYVVDTRNDSLNIHADKVAEPDNFALNKASKALHILSAPLFIIGFSIFNSTVVQFGSDQLIEKPSESLGVFTHWLEWTVKVTIVLIEIFFIVKNCTSKEVLHILSIINQSLPICFLVLLVILLLMTGCTRHRFNRDGVLYNPYKMIYNVFRFAFKNKYSLNPVATYGQPELTRLDNAKECYGGPFKNSEVEDVKYFKRVLIILFALGPVFVLDLPVNIHFNDFTRHTGFSIYVQSLKKTCDSLTPQFFSGVITMFALPTYIWIMYGLLQNRRPKILNRMVLLVLFYILVAASMLVIDTAGHLNLYTHGDPQTECMFDTNKTHVTLNMHWSVIIIPGVFDVVYYLLLATALEFVAAQSPHAMRGVLVGSFFFIVGIFRLLGVLLFIPFRINIIWEDGYLGDHPPVIGCGFGYYSACIVIAVIGFVALLFAVRWYQYRRRDELTLQPANSPRKEDYQQLKD